MLDRAMDLDLAHQLLLGAALRETRLEDHLGGGHGASLLAREFVALGETSLPEKLALEIAADLSLAVRFDDALLHDGRHRLRLGVRAGVCGEDWLLVAGRIHLCSESE